MQVTLIVVTLNRPDCVRRCLQCAQSQEPRLAQIIVVDASAGNETRRVVEGFAGILYLRNENGFGRMTASRNIGLKFATGEIIAFLDDDAFAHADWLKYLLAAYDDLQVGAVGGRALNNQPGEATLGIAQIGRLNANGTLTGFFAADPGKIIAVDHVMGCNMSFRRDVIAQLGGFREDYPGISGLREDTDMCLRVKRLGYKILFCPPACVDHIGASQAVGRRFDVRYDFYSEQNHCILLIRNYGIFSTLFWRYLATMTVRSFALLAKRMLAAIAHSGAACGGILVGVLRGAAGRFGRPSDPVRHDPDAVEIRRVLAAPEVTVVPVVCRPERF